VTVQIVSEARLGAVLGALPGCPRRSRRSALASTGDRVAALVPDGATLQLGIAAVPDAVLAALCGRRGLGLWSEMFSDGVLALHKAGALDPGQQITASFAFGSGVVRLDEPQPGHRHAADGNDQRPGADRTAVAADLDQHRAPG
jgi:hypothetical protein